jgi:ABC-type transporter Mla subunit MlaD
MIDRDRVTERVSASTLKLELRRSLRPLIVLAVGFAITIAAGYYIVDSINGGIGGTHEMRFAVSDATGIVPGRAEVRFYGIQAGEVDSASVAHGEAVLQVSVATKYGPVYRNAVAAVRPNTPLNDMYLDIESRGTPNAGLAGPNDLIPVSQTSSPTNLADVLDTFQPDVRTQLYNLIDQLGNGLADRGADLRRAFVLIAPFLRAAGNLSQQLARRADLTRELIHNTATLSGVLSSRSTALHSLVLNGTSAMQALDTEGGQSLRTTIGLLPTTLQNTITLMHVFDRAFPVADDTIAALRPVARALPNGLTSLTALAQRANPAVVRLEAPVQQLVPLADQLQPFAHRLAQALDTIRPQISTVNDATTDLADCTLEINEFFNWDASMAKWTDLQGPMVRGSANFGFYSVPGVPHNNYTYRKQCAPGPSPIPGTPTPKFDGPAPTP